MRDPGRIDVLHVDDEPSFTALVAEFLTRDDDRFTVETATSASDGLDRLADADFDCVVSDYDMPGQDGITFLETIREEDPDLPFILYTGKGSEEVASDAIAAGATDYLQKRGGTDQYELLANRIQNAVSQYRAERRAAEFDRIRTIARDINQALVRADSRLAAETRVCEIISNSDPYLFAWIGELDQETEQVKPRTWAGVEDGYLDDITVTADETDTGTGPGGVALRERRVAVSQNVADDPEFEPWRTDALERGYRAVAAVPLEYEGTLYGILSVNSARPYAFDDAETELLAELGADIGHAIHSFSIRTELRRNTRAMEEAPIGITLSDPTREDNPVVYANSGFEALTGYDSEAAVGRNCRFLQGERTAPDAVAKLRRAVEAAEPASVELRNYRADGTEFWNRVTIAPVEDEAGDLMNFVGFQEDVTERIAREQAIEELHTTAREFMAAETAEEVGQLAVDTLHETLGMPATGVHFFDEDAGGLVPVAWTERTEEIVGTPPTFAPGEGVAGTAFETGETQLYDDVSTIPERYNEETAVRSQIVLPLDDRGVFVIGSPEASAFDETDVDLARTLAAHATTALERIEYEQSLREYETLVETVGDSMYVLDTEGTIRMANRAMLEYLDADRDAVVGSHISEYMAEGDFERASTLLRTLLTKPERDWTTLEFTAVTADGDRIPGELNLAVLTDDSGAFAGSVGVVRDISERKEREQTLEQQNERLAQFASVVSHDLRSPLNVARGRLELAREDHDSQDLADVADAIDRSLTLIDDLLRLARDGDHVGDVESVDLAAAVDSCWASFESAETTLVSETEQTIRADRSRLTQLLENLFRNAVEHGGADVTVTVGDLEDGDGFYVADDGPGIPVEERDDVFAAGYSSTETGTGLGLNIVQEVAESHNWTVSVTDSEAGGVRFEVTGVETGAA